MKQPKQYTILFRLLPHGMHAAEVVEFGKPRKDHVAGFAAESKEKAGKQAEAWIAGKFRPRRGNGEPCQP